MHIITTPRRIKVTPNSILADILEEAEKAPVILEKNDESYRVMKEKKVTKKEKVYKEFLSSLGSWKDIDTKKMIDFIYNAREEGSRPINRP